MTSNTDDLKGRAKEAVGDLTDNKDRSLTASGTRFAVPPTTSALEGLCTH